jgi:periplasmic divalent cation tolerance protein
MADRRAPGGSLAGAPADADVWIALCTAPDIETAARLGRLAVEGGHAACANLVPGLRSLYRWEGRLADEAEILILLKTTAAAWPGLAALVRLHHPYEVPELIALPVGAGLEPYLRWVAETTGTARVDSPPRGV